MWHVTNVDTLQLSANHVTMHSQSSFAVGASSCKFPCAKDIGHSSAWSKSGYACSLSASSCLSLWRLLTPQRPRQHSSRRIWQRREEQSQAWRRTCWPPIKLVNQTPPLLKVAPA